MNKVILLPLFTFFLFIGLSVNAQESNEIQCTMTVDEILRSQPFDIDEPISEDAKNISILLLSELDIIYNDLSNNNAENIHEHIHLIHTAIVSAKEIGMNYSMFEKDLEFIDSIK